MFTKRRRLTKTLSISGQSGRITTELFVVFAVIGVLWVVGIEKYRDIQANTERLIFDRTLAVLESAIALEHNRQLTSGTAKPPEYWKNLNPMTLLKENVRGYVGEISEDAMLDMKPMEWAFVRKGRYLAYKVSAEPYFYSERPGFSFVRIVVRPIQPEGTQQSTALLMPLENYRWKEKP